MRKATTKRRKSIDFSHGIRGKYAGMKLVVVGATPDDENEGRANKKDPELVLKKVLRVLNSAGNSKRDLEAAVDRARNLIETARQA